MTDNFRFFFAKIFDQGPKYIFWHFYRHLLVSAFVIGIFMLFDLLGGYAGRGRCVLYAP